MKLGYLEYKDLPNKGVDKKDTLNLILENAEDVITYFNWIGTGNGRKLINAWDCIVENVNRGFACNSHLPRDPIFTIAGLQARKKMNERKYSLFELAMDWDEITNDKMRNMLEIIQSGRTVRVNYVGGYSDVESVFDITEEVEASEDMIKQYLVSGTLSELPEIDITTNVLVIENDVHISRELYYWLEDNFKNRDRFYEFKTRTEFLSVEKRMELFNSFLDRGIDTLVLETSAMDRKQFDTTKKAIETLMKQNKDKELSVYIKLNYDDDSILETDVENLKIIKI